MDQNDDYSLFKNKAEFRQSEWHKSKHKVGSNLVCDTKITSYNVVVKKMIILLGKILVIQKSWSTNY
jgi:hypothetical protein